LKTECQDIFAICGTCVVSDRGLLRWLERGPGMSNRIGSIGISLGAIRSLRLAESAVAQSSARGGLSEISALLSEIPALAVQSASGALGGQTRAQLDSQFQAILSDIDAIANNTSFGSFNPLADSSLQIELAVGTEAGDTMTVSGADAQAASIAVIGQANNDLKWVLRLLE
jgi:flagellin-like hook-associated protein FlgL